MKSPAGWIEPKCSYRRMGEWYTLKNGRMVFTREWENGIH